MPSEEGGDAVVASAAAATPAAVSSPRASSSSQGMEVVSSLPEAAPLGANTRRTTRSGSVVVYPENDDAGKPKVFARQSFVVSGEEQEMADTILQARQLAGERRRSTFSAEDKTALEEEIAVVAQNLAARRASTTAPTAPTTDDTGSASAATTAPTTIAADPGCDADAAARRRSSVMKLPDNLRALVQQSDASGVQKKAASPYNPQSASAGTSQAPATTSSAAGTLSPSKAGDPAASSSDGSNLRTQGQSWMSNVMAFIRWKKLSIKPSKKKGGEGKGGGSGTGAVAGGDNGATPRASPTPGGGAGRGMFRGKTRSLLPKQLPEFAGRKQLILDLDETLVHSSFKPVAGADFIMDIMVDGTFYKVFVLKRPGVEEFLERVAKLYEVIIFTASLPQYANPLLDLLDPKGTITSRLFREHCTFHEGYFVKDLTLLRHESLETTIIVDNSPMAYMFQPENAIDCISWIDDRADKELGVIADFLETIVNVPDVRDLLEFWREGAAVLDNVC